MILIGESYSSHLELVYEYEFYLLGHDTRSTQAPRLETLVAGIQTSPFLAFPRGVSNRVAALGCEVAS